MNKSEYGFVDLSDQKVMSQFTSQGKNVREIDPRWDTCPPGHGFFVPVTPREYAEGKKRPTVPAKYKGQFKTTGFDKDRNGDPGYLVSRYKNGYNTSRGTLPFE